MKNIFNEILEELRRATKKFPTWPTDPIHAKAILDEEVGELCQAILETIYELPKSNKENVKKEAFQVAAMAVRFIINFDKYDYQKSKMNVNIEKECPKCTNPRVVEKDGDFFCPCPFCGDDIPF